MDDIGVPSQPAINLLRDLAAYYVSPSRIAETLLEWKAELQHIVRNATAGIAQNAAGCPHTS